MTFDICPSCDGSGFRNELEGSKCFTCNGLGMVEDEDPDDDDDDDDYDMSDEEAEWARQESKRNDDIERGDYERDRAKDERSETRNRKAKQE